MFTPDSSWCAGAGGRGMAVGGSRSPRPAPRCSQEEAASGPPRICLLLVHRAQSSASFSCLSGFRNARAVRKQKPRRSLGRWFEGGGVSSPPQNASERGSAEHAPRLLLRWRVVRAAGGWASPRGRDEPGAVADAAALARAGSPEALLLPRATSPLPPAPRRALLRLFAVDTAPCPACGRKPRNVHFQRSFGCKSVYTWRGKFFYLVE